MDAPLDNWEAQIRRGWLEVAILASLWPGRLYGLEIIRALAENSDLVAGLVDAEWVESVSGHPRKYYKLTAVGRKTTLVLARNSNVFLRKMLALVEPLLKENKR
jgi:PadR family transcriptional regulator PadR